MGDQAGPKYEGARSYSPRSRTATRVSEHAGDVAREAGGYATFAALLNRVQLAALHAGRGKLTDRDRGVLQRILTVLEQANAPRQGPAPVLVGRRSMADFRDSGVLLSISTEEPSDGRFNGLMMSVRAVLGDDDDPQHAELLRLWFGRMTAQVLEAAEEVLRPNVHGGRWTTTTTS